MISFICSATTDQTAQDFMIQVYDAYGRLMFSIAQEMAPKDTEDIVQESLLRLIAKVDLLQTLDQARLVNYVSTTTKHTAYTFLRKKKKEDSVFFSVDQEIDDFPDPDGSVEEQFLRADSPDALCAVWPSLSVDDRIVLSGRYILRQTDAELAEDLGCSADSVRMKLTRARRRAKALLKKQEETEGK